MSLEHEQEVVVGMQDDAVFVIKAVELGQVVLVLKTLELFGNAVRIQGIVSK